MGYDCIDPLSECVDDDDNGVSWGDDDWFECASEFSMCFNDDDCEACFMSSYSSSSMADDDILDTCAPSVDTCNAWAGFYCCAIEEDMGEQCADNSELVNYIGGSAVPFDFLVRGCAETGQVLRQRFFLIRNLHNLCDCTTI